MSYKVIFVEDEIITREGIRDNVDWAGHGFEFCGEAPDGEIALQLIQSIRPDLVITDIKMPFMDGLQLAKIVRERMPWVKIVFLSGHDEFEYAQQAIQLGVTEYLLKPVTVPDLHAMLRKISARLEQERVEQQKLRSLQDQLAENQAALRERFLRRLVVGGVTSGEAMEKSQQLGLDLVARCYLVVLVKTELADRSEQYDYDEHQQFLQNVADLVANNPDIFCLRRDWEELILLIKGNSPEILAEERDLLLDRIQHAALKTRYRLVVGVGTPRNRITLIYQSFVDALASAQAASAERKPGTAVAVDKTELLRVDKSAVEHFLRSGTREDFDAFFNSFVKPLGETALKSNLIKNYILVDVVLAIVRFVDELGGVLDQAVSVFNSIESMSTNIQTRDQLREQVRQIVLSALEFRDRQSGNPYLGVIKQAKETIEQRYADPNLMLNDVAACVNLSPSYFSMVFSQETGSSFKDYLTGVRIQKARELLRMTRLKAAEIADRVGYSDSHYFSYVFKKNTGLSPTEFRLQVTDGQEGEKHEA